jgi:hypothetical protein
MITAQHRLSAVTLSSADHHGSIAPEPWFSELSKVSVNLQCRKLSIETQKFPPKGSNDSPYQSVDQGCYEAQLEYIWKLEVPRCRRKATGY